MKIGILVPDGPVPEEFLDGLRSAGVDVGLFISHSPDFPALSSVRAGAFLREASDCDLIHNLAGPLGLLLASACGKPLITSLAESTPEEDMAVFRAASPACFFVSEHGLDAVGGLPAIPGMVPFTGDRAGFYLEAYTRLLALGRKREQRPWGSFEVLSDDRADHKVKRIVVLPGKRLSLQYHGRRREHWIVVAGEALVTVGSEIVRLVSAQSVDIPRGAAHRVENAGATDLIFIEVQQGDYFGEDDIVRIEDDFGRA